MKRVLNFTEFVNESDSTYTESKNYIMDNFNEVPNNGPLYNATEQDFADLPWFKALKGVDPEFKLEKVRSIKRKNLNEANWIFTVPFKNSRGQFTREYFVERPSDRNSISEGPAEIRLNKSNLIRTKEFSIFLNDRESWNKIFKVIYLAEFGNPVGFDAWRSVDKMLDLFSSDLESLYKEEKLGVIGVKKDPKNYMGNYESEVKFIKNLPYGIYDKIKETLIKKIKEEPGAIQYALSQSQLPPGTAEKGSGTNLVYPNGEILNFYNLLKQEGFVPPEGFEEETGEVKDLLGSLGDIGL